MTRSEQLENSYICTPEENKIIQDTVLGVTFGAYIASRNAGYDEETSQRFAREMSVYEMTGWIGAMVIHGGENFKN